MQKNGEKHTNEKQTPNRQPAKNKIQAIPL